jgi:hypothetical protein
MQDHAVHVASAISLGAEVGQFVTYDARMQEAATGAGLAVDAPAWAEPVRSCACCDARPDPIFSLAGSERDPVDGSQRGVSSLCNGPFRPIAS